MKLPLRDSDTLIHAVLREQWRLEVSSIHFIPMGDSAYSYRIETQPDSSYYLKLVDQRSFIGKRTATQMKFSLPLQQLVAQVHLTEVNTALPQATSTGMLYAIHGPFLMALYTFIHGKTLVDAYPMSPELIRRIGQALAAIHSIQLPQTLQQQVPQDSLTAPYAAELLLDLAALETISSHDALFFQQLREIVYPRREQIRAFMAHSQEYGKKAQQTHVATVVCHGDAWGGNMIMSPSEQLTFVDWESAVLAPPERDAFVYMDYLRQNVLGQDFSAFNAGYRMIHTEPMQWHTNWLSYYAYRIQLRNLATWLHKLLHEALDDLQRNHDMYLIEHHCLDRLENVERTARELTGYSSDGCM